MKKERDFVSTITKLTEDFAVYKRQCFKFGSKQLTKKLLGLMEKIEEEMEKSIEVVKEELRNINSKCVDSLWEDKVVQVLENKRSFGDSDYLIFLRNNYRDLQKLVREYARTKLLYTESLDKIIELLPECADMTPQFPLHLAFLGILTNEEDFFCDETTPGLIGYYKQKIQKLMDNKQYIDMIFRAKLETFVLVQQKSLEEARKNRLFLLENSIDDASTVRYFGKFCKKGYLDTLD